MPELSETRTCGDACWNRKGPGLLAGLGLTAAIVGLCILALVVVGVVIALCITGVDGAGRQQNVSAVLCLLGAVVTLVVAVLLYSRARRLYRRFGIEGADKDCRGGNIYFRAAKLLRNMQGAGIAEFDGESLALSGSLGPDVSLWMFVSRPSTPRPRRAGWLSAISRPSPRSTPCRMRSRFS